VIVTLPVAISWFDTDRSGISRFLALVLSGLAALLAASGTRDVRKARRSD
jgi:hypothetical protein